jgi:polyphosphate kinase 2 (PPK2 family)
MLEQLDPTKKLKRREWEALYPPLQRRLHDLQMAACRAGLPVIMLFEGWDTAGKGGCIAALTQALDPRGFKVWPIRAPRPSELDYPWLWRFWIKLPGRGEIAIFDRSWYRRALVERVEGLISEDECRHTLRDIADLEQMLAADGYVIVKFWLHIGQDDQWRRLKLREKRSPAERLLKAWEQNRHYEEYLLAAEEMVARTHTKATPWIIVEATDPFYAWWKVYDTVVGAIAEGLRARGIDPDAVDESSASAVPCAGLANDIRTD